MCGSPVACDAGGVLDSQAASVAATGRQLRNVLTSSANNKRWYFQLDACTEAIIYLPDNTNTFMIMRLCDNDQYSVTEIVVGGIYVCELQDNMILSFLYPHSPRMKIF